MANTSVVVHLEIVPEKFEEFVEIARSHGARSLELEEGCLRFDVMILQELDNQLILVEVYEDDAALEMHWNSAHMSAYLEKVQYMIAARTRYRCTV